jgi:hypothetical protein
MSDKRGVTRGKEQGTRDAEQAMCQIGIEKGQEMSGRPLVVSNSASRTATFIRPIFRFLPINVKSDYKADHEKSGKQNPRRGSDFKG